jgi:hypothetical protein
MMKPIRTLGAAVVALAAPVLLAAPAAADTRSVARIETRISDTTTLTLALGSSGYDSYRYRGPDYRRGYNHWGQSEREVRELTRDAVQVCRQAVRYEARQLGFDDVEFDDDRHVRQVGPFGFQVTFEEVEFEDRKRDRETSVFCEVRRGEVIALDGIPRPHKGKGYGRGW